MPTGIPGTWSIWGRIDSVDRPRTFGRRAFRHQDQRIGHSVRVLGAKAGAVRAWGGRFPQALVEQAKRVSGIAETTDLLTYALVRLALEDDFGTRLLARKGRLPKGTFVAD